MTDVVDSFDETKHNFSRLASLGGPRTFVQNSVWVLSYDYTGALAGIWQNGIPPTYGALSGFLAFSSSGRITRLYQNQYFMDFTVTLGDCEPAVTNGKWIYGPYAMAYYRGFPSAANLAELQTRYADGF